MNQVRSPPLPASWAVYEAVLALLVSAIAAVLDRSHDKGKNNCLPTGAEFLAASSVT